MTSGHHSDRFLRHALIDWFDQEAVSRAKFAVIGAGAIGNEVIKNLALLGVGAVDIYDLDQIESHNLTRSVLFRPSDVGRRKATVAAERAQELSPDLKVSSFHSDFWQVFQLTSDSKPTAIISCVDNFEARIRANQIAQFLGVDLITTGIDSRFASVEYFPFARSANSACYECGLPESAYARMAQRYSCGYLKRVAYIEKRIPTTIVTASIAGALTSSFALSLTLGSGGGEAMRVLTDTKSGNSQSFVVTQKSDCPGCVTDRAKLQIVLSSREVTPGWITDCENIGGVTVRFSEPVVVAGKCRICGYAINKGEPFMWLTSDHDSRLGHCGVCADDSVALEIRQQFEFNELLQRFAGTRLPVKFLEVLSASEKTIIELI